MESKKNEPLTGQAALDFFEEIKKRNVRQMAEELAEERAKAQRSGKEPFDLVKLETLCDTSSEGRYDTIERRRASFEYEYYVQHPSIMTLSEFAAYIERANKG